MKKRAVMTALLLAVSIAAAGCKQKSETTSGTDNQTETNQTEENTDGKETEDEEETPTTAELLADIDVAKCVTLGEYKGIKVEKTIESVTDEDVENEIQTALANYPVEVSGRSAQEGDTVNIDYVGKIDGEEFEGGSDQGADLRLGSGQFIDGFEDGLIGASKGETRTLNLTFPEGYTEELSGKEVEFTVTVNPIKAPLEEATDEWVAANIEGYYTLEEYRSHIRSEQEETNQQSAEEQVKYTAWTTVVDGCTINEYPETLVEMGRNLYIQQAEMYAQYSAMELSDFIEAAGLTQEEFDTNADEYGKSIAAQALVNQAICDAEGFAIGDEAYQEALQEMLTQYNCDTAEDLYGRYGRDNVEQSIMLDRVTQLILENAVIEEVSADEEASADDEESTEEE